MAARDTVHAGKYGGFSRKTEPRNVPVKTRLLRPTNMRESPQRQKHPRSSSGTSTSSTSTSTRQEGWREERAAATNQSTDQLQQWQQRRCTRPDAKEQLRLPTNGADSCSNKEGACDYLPQRERRLNRT